MCLIAPRDPHTDIGVAEGSGTRTYCAFSFFSICTSNPPRDLTDCKFSFSLPFTISFFTPTDSHGRQLSDQKNSGTAQARYDKVHQGQLPADFFSDAKYVSYNGPSGGEIRQITGCIRASHLSRLNPKDGGGQFDSSGQGYVSLRCARGTGAD